MVKIQHFTLNDMTHPVTSCMSIGAKSGFTQKGHDLLDCHRLHLQQK